MKRHLHENATSQNLLLRPVFTIGEPCFNLRICSTRIPVQRSPRCRYRSRTITIVPSTGPMIRSTISEYGRKCRSTPLLSLVLFSASVKLERLSSSALLPSLQRLKIEEDLLNLLGKNDKQNDKPKTSKTEVAQAMEDTKRSEYEETVVGWQQKIFNRVRSQTQRVCPSDESVALLFIRSNSMPTGKAQAPRVPLSSTNITTTYKNSSKIHSRHAMTLISSSEREGRRLDESSPTSKAIHVALRKK